MVPFFSSSDKRSPLALSSSDFSAEGVFLSPETIDSYFRRAIFGHLYFLSPVTSVSHFYRFLFLGGSIFVACDILFALLSVSFLVGPINGCDVRFEFSPTVLRTGISFPAADSLFLFRR